MQRANSLGKTLMVGKIEGRRRSGSQRMRRSDGIFYTMDMRLSKPQEIVKEREAWCVQPMGSQSRRRLHNWTTNAKLKHNYDHKKNHLNGFINNQLDGLRKNSYSCRHRVF